MYFLDYDQHSLMHYGVKGMKWGVRKQEEMSRSFDRTNSMLKKRNSKRSEKKNPTRYDIKTANLLERQAGEYSARAHQYKIKAEKANKKISRSKSPSDSVKSKYAASSKLSKQYANAAKKYRSQGAQIVNKYKRSGMNIKSKRAFMYSQRGEKLVWSAIILTSPPVVGGIAGTIAGSGNTSYGQRITKYKIKKSKAK